MRAECYERRDNWRSWPRLLSRVVRQPVIAVLVTADALAGHPKLLSQRHAFMAFRTALSRYRCRRRRRRVVERHDDVVNSVTVRAHRRARNAADNRLAVNALHEFVRFGAMAFAAGVGYVD